MQRFKITVEYDGRPFVGWQRQKAQMSVQQAIEEAITKFTGQFVAVQGSGRTDSGVHGMGQVAHFDIEKSMSPFQVMSAINFHLKPHPISVLDIAEVDADFHARFDASRRHYTYKIMNRRPPLTFRKGLMWHVKLPLDIEAMQQGANHLIGMHDFTTFRHSHCQAKSPVKSIDYLTINRIDDTDEVHLLAGAQSFLHHQIRSITGTLSLVGLGRWHPDDVKEALEAKDRTRLGLNAPPDGLYFRSVDYPEK